MAAILTYAGVGLPHVRTDLVEQKFVLDEANLNLYREDIAIPVQAVFYPYLTTDAGRDSNPLLPGETLAAGEARLRHLLSYPRRPLEYLLPGGNPLWRVMAAPRQTRRDPSTGLLLPGDPPLPDGWEACVAGGPYPELLNIGGISEGCLIVNFRVRFSVRRCPNDSPGQPPGLVLAHVYKDTVRIDDTFHTTRVRSGTIRVRPGTDPNLLRHLMTPPIPDGFLRVSSEHDVQQDGLAWAYKFTDVEQDVMPPLGAVKADGDVSVTCDRSRKVARVSFTLTGHRYTPKNKLMGVAVAAAVQKLEDLGAIGAVNGLINGIVRYKPFRNEVGVMLESRVVAAGVPQVAAKKNFVGGLVDGGGLGLLKLVPDVLAGEVAGIAALGDNPNQGAGRPADQGQINLPKFNSKKFFNPPWGVVDTPPDPGLFGSGGIFLLATALKDPCLAEYARQQQPLPQRPTESQLVADPDNALDLGRFKGQQTSSLPPELRAAAPGGDVAPAPAGTAVRPATVTVVPQVSDPVSSPSFSVRFPYLQYDIEPTIERDPGTVVMASTKGPGDSPSDKAEPAQVVRLRNPTAKKVVRWYAERVGAPPAPPPVAEGDPNWVVLSVDDSPGQVTAAADGVTPIYTAGGRRVYQAKDPDKVTAAAALSGETAQAMSLGELVLTAGPRTTPTGELLPIPDPFKPNLALAGAGGAGGQQDRAIFNGYPVNRPRAADFQQIPAGGTQPGAAIDPRVYDVLVEFFGQFGGITQDDSIETMRQRIRDFLSQLPFLAGQTGTP